MVKCHTIYQCKFQINRKSKYKNENIGVLEKKIERITPLAETEENKSQTRR